MIDISVLKMICKLKGIVCYHFNEDCVTCMKRKDLRKSEDDPPEIHQLLISYPIEFERYYNRRISRIDVIVIS